MMLRNTKLGTKLLAVILPPLIVLVVVAGIGANDRLEEASDARAADEYIELAGASSATVTTMQWERNLSLYALASGEDVSELLDERRARADAEWDRFSAAADAVMGSDDATLDPLIESAAAHRSRIESFRSTIDSGSTDVRIVRSGFDQAIDDHLSLMSEVSNSVPVVEVSADLASFSALAEAKEASAQTGAALVVALASGEFDAEGRQWRSMRESEASFERYESLFYDISPAELQSELRGALGSSEAQEAESMRLQVIAEAGSAIDWIGDGSAIGDPVQLDFDAGRWVDLSESRLEAIGVVGDDILGEVSSYVSTVRTESEQSALLFLLVTAAAVLLSAVLAVVVARRVTRPLRELTDAADRLSGEQLPALVERLRNPSESSGGVTLEPIGMRRTDEIGHLADAFDSIQRVTVEVAEEQANLLRKGIGDIFVNLARRNQTLLDRQIEFIDQLESSEDDPDVLEDLFKLDHLATRMRRNAESLLVLAGVDTGHRRSKPVPLADVVRVAIGEVEDFARLNLLSLDDAMVTGTAAMDVAHLLSELMENATSFSPPETNVEILGHQSPDGYVISISDQGIGMSEEQFAEANRLLADPPLVGLTLSRSLGFTVVGRLADRFDINVRLTSSPTGGVTALVTLPDSVLHAAPEVRVEPDEEQAEEEALASTEPEPAPADAMAESMPVLDLEPDLPQPNEPAPDWVSPAPASTSLASAVPEGEAFDAGLAALMGEDSTTADDQDHEDPNTDETAPSEPSAAPSLFSDAAMSSGDGDTDPTPSEGGVTSAGLVRRVPRAHAPAEETVERPGGSTSVAASQRSPEEVRAMLSRYRSGLQRANQPSDGTGPSDSGSDSTN
ncbi:MAG: nitrate- and nitrite sensing domain-containing protein [Acidimicrobiales bacterium]